MSKLSNVDKETDEVFAEIAQASSMSATGPRDFKVGDEMRFRNAFIEIIEELKMRREHDAETEEYVKQLLDAKGTMEQDLELERRNSENLQNKLFKQESEIRRKYETQLTVLEEEKRKAEARNIYEESEVKGLRDEIKTLHMDKFNLERRCKEQERKLVMVNSSRDSIMSQTTQLGQKCSLLKNELESVTHQVDQLQTCVRGAEELCCKLSYANSHQECQLEQYRKELEQTKRKLLDAKVCAEARLGPTEDELLYRKMLKSSEQEVKMAKDLNVKLEHRVGEMRKEQARLVDALSKAHNLVESHVQGNRELNERNHCLEKEVDDGKERERRVREQLEEMEQHTEILKHKLNMRSEDWEETIQDVEDKLALLQKEKRKLEDKCSSLQEERDQQSVYRSKLEASLQTERDSFQEKLKSVTHQAELFQKQLEEQSKQWGMEKNSLLRKLSEQERSTRRKVLPEEGKEESHPTAIGNPTRNSDGMQQEDACSVLKAVTSPSAGRDAPSQNTSKVPPFSALHSSLSPLSTGHLLPLLTERSSPSPPAVPELPLLSPRIPDSPSTVKEVPNSPSLSPEMLELPSMTPRVTSANPKAPDMSPKATAITTNLKVTSTNPNLATMSPKATPSSQKTTSLSPKVAPITPRSQSSVPKPPDSPLLSTSVPEPPSLSPLLILIPVQCDEEASPHQNSIDPMANQTDCTTDPECPLHMEEIPCSAWKAHKSIDSLQEQNNDHTTMSISLPPQHCESSLPCGSTSDTTARQPPPQEGEVVPSPVHCSSVLPSKRHSPHTLSQEGEKRLKYSTSHFQGHQEVSSEGLGQQMQQRSVEEDVNPKACEVTVMTSIATQSNDVPSFQKCTHRGKFSLGESTSSVCPEGEKETAEEEGANKDDGPEILLSDSDNESDNHDDILTSSMAQAISSVEQFLKRDRLRCTKRPVH